MRIDILYGVIIKFSDGGENMDSYMIKDSAINKAKEIINLIKTSNKKGIKVYLSELEYNSYKNVILSDHLIDSDSELLFES